MNHGSLFSGIGGFDLAAQWMGWDNVFQVEWDGYCQKVLEKNFPNVSRYGNIKEFDGTKYRGTVDVLSGGFPCQPFSTAGKRKGESDDRYLWPEYFRVIREIQPTYVVGENVAGLVSMDDGKTLDGILSDLEGEGYQTEQFLIPACGVGAWHRRDRIWIVGYLPGRINSYASRSNPDSIGSHRSKIEQQGKADFRDKQKCRSKGLGQDVSNPTGRGLQGGKSENKGVNRKAQRNRSEQTNNAPGSCEDVSATDINRLQRSLQQGINDKQWGDRQKFIIEECGTSRPKLQSERERSTESRVGDMVDGLPSGMVGYWDREPEAVPRVCRGIKDRSNRLKGLGNAIVPQVAYEIFRAIQSTILI
jgi:DNA (cytosine-5)-methyltransferase 1